MAHRFPGSCGSCGAPDRHPAAELRLRDYRPRRRAVTAATAVARPSSPVVDAHNHLGRWLTEDWSVPDVPALLDTMDACGVEAVVNLDGRWGSELEANLDRYDRAFPGRFVTYCHLDWSVLRTASGAAAAADALVRGLRASAAAGAAGLKIWKDLGLHQRDARGDLVLLDDPRLADALDVAGELGLPVAVHSADPVAFFDPVDGANERLEQLLEYPEWSFADRARYPGFERLLEALERAVAAHPATTFVGVHVGCWAEDLGEVRRMLAAYPHYAIDLAARVDELGRQPRAAAALIRDHPGRVLFGTDTFPPTAGAYRAHYRFVESGDECYDADPDDATARWAVSALDLGSDRDAVARAELYAGAARRLVPALAR